VPAISVIIPTYNNQNTILETIVSVQQQTFSDFDIIVINDGSTDKTVEILNTVQDKRLKIFSYENGGVSVARNRGISVATGKYIAFLDADDLWTKDKLELQFSALEEKPEAVLAYSWTYTMSENGEQIHKCDPIFFEGNVYNQLLMVNFIISPCSNILVLKEAIDNVGDFDSSLTHCEDWDLCLRLSRKWSFVVVPKYQVFYRQSLVSASSNIEAFEKSIVTVMERAFQYAPKEIQFLKAKSIANGHLYWAQLYLSRFGDLDGIKQARSQLLKAIFLYPKLLADKKTYILLIKLMIRQLITPKLAVLILRFISKIRTTDIKKIV
jgi:glycosyltransferase involved in cell wall biosynthesis